MGIIAVNVLVYLFLNVANTSEAEYANTAFGFIPSVAHDIRVLPAEYRLVPDNFYWLTAITSSFIHADLLHLVGNMLFIWVFADNVEDATGHFKFLIFYLLCGVAGAWFHAFTFPDSDAPLIGASGAAAGVLAAYLMLHPKVKIWVLVFVRIPMRLSAQWLLGGWIAYQAYMYFADPSGQISWAAHIGGILAGIPLVIMLKRRQVKFFDQTISAATPQDEPEGTGEEVQQKPEQTTWGSNASSR